jgi:Protein of unknown function (DUF2867)
LKHVTHDTGVQSAIGFRIARFQLCGPLGIFYWYGIAPFHQIVFGGMLKGIREKAPHRAADPQWRAKELAPSGQI